MAHLATDRPAPHEWAEFVLADRFKWTLEYVRSLTLPDFLKLLTMMSAESKAAKAKNG